jgi:hypothetical protein
MITPWRSATYHSAYIVPNKTSNSFCATSDIKEKNAPAQSMARNTKSIPTTLPLRLTSSNGIGKYAAMSKTNAIAPTVVTGHSTPREYAGRMANTRPACTAAKTTNRPVSRAQVVHALHFLHTHISIASFSNDSFPSCTRPSGLDHHGY